MPVELAIAWKAPVVRMGMTALVALLIMVASALLAEVAHGSL